MSDWFGVVGIIVAIVAVVYAFVATKQAFTAANVTTALERVQPLASELSTVATTIVQANEQRKREGTLTNAEAYNSALDYVRGWFPVTVGITNAQIIAAINSAILIASAATAQIEASKAAIPAKRIPGPPPMQIPGSTSSSATDKPLILGR